MTISKVKNTDEERLKRLINKEGKFFKMGVCDLKTICEVHRVIYRKLKDDAEKNAEVIELLYLAYGMAKKMNNKLRQYKYNYDANWWKKHKFDGDNLDKEN